MPLSIIAFFIALFQFFQTGGRDIATGSFQPTVHVSARVQAAFHTVSAQKIILRGTLESEETTDDDTDAGKTLRDAVAKDFTIRIFASSVHRAERYDVCSYLFPAKTPLFVLHCNFRV